MLTSNDNLPSTVNAVLTGIGLTAVMLIIAFLCGLLIGKYIYQLPRDTICIPESRYEETVLTAAKRNIYLNALHYCEKICSNTSCQEKCVAEHLEE